MFFRHPKPIDRDWKVEDVAGRLRRVLAQAGPHDDRIGHHQTQTGNTDPTKTGLALVSTSDIHACRSRHLWLALSTSPAMRRTGTEE
jgi:hypothetical protein